MLRLKTVETERVVRRLGTERARVELHARLRRPRFHDTTGARLNGAGGEDQRAIPGGAVDHEIMVVAAAGPELRGPGAERAFRGEIQVRLVDTFDLTGGDEGRVDDGVGVGVEGELVVQHVSATGEVEVGVVREIDGRGLVRRRRVFEAQRVLVGERVANAGRERAGKALFTVCAHVGQRHGGDAGSRRGRGGPHDAAEVFRAAVDVVRFAVRRHLHLASIEGEAGVRDAVGHATEDRAGLGKASGETLLAGGDFADDTAEFSIAVSHA